MDAVECGTVCSGLVSMFCQWYFAKSWLVNPDLWWVHYSHLHSLAADLFRSSVPSAECLYPTTQHYIPNRHNHDPDCVATSNVILYIPVIFQSFFL